MSNLADLLARLWEQSQPIITERIETIEAAVLAALAGDLGGEQRREAEREAHKLAGSLGTFGRHEGTRVAREIELLMQGSAPPRGEALLRLSELAVELRTQAQAPAAPAGAEPEGPGAEDSQGPGVAEPPAGPPAVLVVDGDAEHALRLVEAAVAHGMRAWSAADVATAQSASSRRPDLVVMDPATAGDPDLSYLAHVAAGPDPRPVIIVTDPAAGVDRAAVVRAGARAYLEKSMAPRAVMRIARRTVERGAQGAAVLVVDDDPTVTELLADLLGTRGLRVVGLDDPRLLWSELQRVRPDILVLDFDMPHLDGLQLCRMVRGDEAWARLPVVFLSGSASPPVVRALYAAGADDHVAKPFDPEDLVTRVLNRLDRSRHLAELWDTDAATGLANRRGFTTQCQRLIELARREAKPFTLALVAPDEGPSADHPAGPSGPGLGPLVRRSVAPGDAVGVLSQHRIGVGLFGSSLAEASDRLGGVLEAARGAATVSAGLARFPADGGDVATLVDAASRALDLARASGGDQVRAVRDGADDSAPTAVDVLVVDDDEALATVLLHALTTRGYRAQWVTDGAEAAALLGGEASGGLRARVVLLDVGLPGLDGLSLLRDMASRGLLDHTRVIMVTLRSTETEVLTALDLGAFDHVAKPFSLPVLLHRVRRAIESLPA
jgi:DNA-binding response OmpR family regulator/HPt (histidine-containing phosphotransfer) domain-containing protein